MGLKTFFGGVHPKDSKAFCKDVFIETMPPPKLVKIHLSQHIGRPAKPIVKVGQQVLAGELIGEAQSAVSCNIHSSVSGKVKKIGLSQNSAGIKSQAIFIESDNLDKSLDFPENTNYIHLPKEELLKRIVDGGICGMGGAGFPAHIKLASKNINTLILNGVECEPFINADYRLMIEKPDEIVNGMRVFMKILGCKKGYIGIEANKPEAIKIMKKSVKHFKEIKVVGLKLKYPQGAEKPLIYACTKREVPTDGGLPGDVGVVVQNVATSYAAYEAVRYKKPLYERVLSVSGVAVRKPMNILARVGTSMSDVVEFARGTIKDVGKIISGGPMMGVAIPDLECSISKTTSSILLFDTKQAKELPEHTCIHCGRCIDVCPLLLLPSRMANASKHSVWKVAKSCGAQECMLCGCCSYVCPSHIKLVQWISIAKKELSK